MKRYQQAPPPPDRVVTADGRTIIGPGEIAAGQDGALKPVNG